MVNRRRILYLISASRWNGTSTYIHALALHAVRLNFDVMVAVNRRGPLIARCAAHDIPRCEAGGFWGVLGILFRFRPHVLHTADTRSAAIGGLAFFVYRMLFLRFDAISIHTIRSWAFTEPSNRARRVVRKFMARALCGFPDTLILLSRADHQTALEYRIAPKNKLTIIPLGIDPESIALLSRDEARAKLLEAEFRDRIVIGMVGEFSNHKGHRYLLEAFASLKHSFREHRPQRTSPIHLLLIGSGDVLPELKKKAEILRIENDMTFVANAIPASPYLAAFDIFVLPSLCDGLPYALLEAGAAALPVIATDFGGNPDVIQHEKTGLLVPPGNAGKIAAGIMRLIATPEFAGGLATRLRDHVSKNFALKESLAKTFSLY